MKSIRKLRLLTGLGAALAAQLVLAAGAGATPFVPPEAHSQNAKDLNTLYWIGTILATVVSIAIALAILVIVRRYRSERGAEPRQLRSGRAIQIRVGAGLAVGMLALFIVSIVFTEKSREIPSGGTQGLEASANTFAQRNVSIPSGKDNDPLRINATGQQWLWRYEYPNGASTYYQLVVPVDTPVLMDLVSTDVTHSWFVPAFGGKFDAVPGKVNHAFFKADEEGTYDGESSTFSGQGYAAMRTQVKVVSAAEYKKFVSDQVKAENEAQKSVADQIASGDVP